MKGVCLLCSMSLVEIVGTHLGTILTQSHRSTACRSRKVRPKALVLLYGLASHYHSVDVHQGPTF